MGAFFYVWLAQVLALSYDSIMRWSLLLLSLLAFAANAVIYRSVDESGNVVYSDRPAEDAEKIELDATPTYTPIDVPQPQAIDGTQDDAAQELEQPNYQISIISPEQNQSVWENAGTVNIEVAIKPELSMERGDLIQFKLDGQNVGQAQTSPSFTLTNIDRGSHIVVATIIDKTGKVLKSSRSVLFHLHRRSLINNPASVNPNSMLLQPRPAQAAPNAVSASNT